MHISNMDNILNILHVDTIFVLFLADLVCQMHPIQLPSVRVYNALASFMAIIWTYLPLFAHQIFGVYTQFDGHICFWHIFDSYM